MSICVCVCLFVCVCVCVFVCVSVSQGVSGLCMSVNLICSNLQIPSNIYNPSRLPEIIDWMSIMSILGFRTILQSETTLDRVANYGV